MKYIKAIDLLTNQDAIVSGKLKLQRGQWVRCCGDRSLSQYVGLFNQGRDIWVAHPITFRKKLWEKSPQITMNSPIHQYVVD